MEELTLKIGLFHHKFNYEVDVLQRWTEIFKEIRMILWYWSGFKAQVRIWSGLELKSGPDLALLSKIHIKSQSNTYSD